MMMKPVTSLSMFYRDALRAAVHAPDHKPSPRDQLTHELEDVSMIHLCPEYDDGYLHGRTSLTYLKAELAWYLSGRNDTEKISETATMWRQIANPDGTANSAYGHTIFTTGQWERTVQKLRRDPETRQAVITIHNPSWFSAAALDVPCTLSLTFRLRDNTLDMITVMRSQDLWYGVPYDSPFFMLLQKMMAVELTAKIGKWVHHVHSLHLYARNFHSVPELQNQLTNPVRVNMPLSQFKLSKDVRQPMFDRISGPLVNWINLKEWI